MTAHRIEATRRLGAAAVLVFMAACGTPVRDSRACTDDSDCRRGQRCGSRGCVSNDAPDSGCVPATCAVLNAQCGQFDDGCGGTLVCGECDEGELCDAVGRCSDPLGDACATRYDCPDSFICISDRCVRPDDICHQDTECPRGQICNFSQWCEPGCVDARDCDGPELCHPQTFVCEPCSRDNPCAAGLSCLDGECKAAAACTATQDCLHDGTVCVDGSCTNCKRQSECAVDPYLDEARECGLDGLCRQVVCDDETCRDRLGNLGYCDTATNKCLTRQCLSDADCTQAGAECRLSDFVCVASGCDTASCHSECAAQGLGCNTATCRCSGAPGGPGEPCAEAADCSDGYVCGNGVCAEAAVTSTGEACDGFVCLMTGCIGALTGRACDAAGCLLAYQLGVPAWCE